MFGHRNGDRPLDSQPQPSQDSDLDLDIFDELPDSPEPEQADRAVGQPDPTETEAPADLPLPDPSWHAATPAILGPSVTRLLQEAEAARQRPVAGGQLPAGLEPAAPAQRPASTGSVTQQLSLDQVAPQPAVPPVLASAPRVAEVPPPPAPQPRQPVVAPEEKVVPQAARPRTIAESVIGPDDFFDGRYRSERGVRIQGNARGSIESRQYIFVEAGAQVEADLSAEDITVSGDFRGKIVCRRRLEVTSSGKIQGQVQTSLLVVQEGGAVDGELHMRNPEQANADSGGA